jgi:FHA domain/TIR domain
LFVSAVEEDLEARRNRPKYIVGRRLGNDIVIDDISVSSRHCCITILPENRFEVTDLGSANGTFISNSLVAIKSAVIGSTDVIRLGQYETTIARLLLQVQDPLKLALGRQRRIFISYRRSDTEHIAGRLFDSLSAEYGAHEIFFDTQTIPGAVAFESRIRDAIGASAVVLALIGKSWTARKRSNLLSFFLGAAPDVDFVERELEIAFSLLVPVIPLLIGDAEMPHPNKLSDSTRGIVALNAIRVRSGRDFHSDVLGIIAAIDQFRSRAACAASTGG